jgi:hypothetical protein
MEFDSRRAAFGAARCVRNDWKWGEADWQLTQACHASIFARRSRMLLAAYFFARAVADGAAQAVIKSPIIPPSTPDAGPVPDILDPPLDQSIGEIERLARSRPWKFEPSGELKMPEVEIENLACIKSSFRHFACKYDIRIREYGEAQFGPWIARGKVFTQIESGWVMLNAEEKCSKIEPENLPGYCFPKD